jgi:hypothetical protein
LSKLQNIILFIAGNDLQYRMNILYWVQPMRLPPVLLDLRCAAVALLGTGTASEAA